MLVDILIKGFIPIHYGHLLSSVPQFIKNRIQGPASVILWKPDKKTMRTPLSIMTAFSQDRLRHVGQAGLAVHSQGC